MVRVSVVVPIYNVARYLPECLDSLRRQTISDIEIICVDDGSTDDSAEIVRRFAELDDRIRLVSQENAGAGVARNRGLETATGEFLFFCDPDDWCEPDMLEALSACGERNDADVVICTIARFNSATRKDLGTLHFYDSVLEKLSTTDYLTPDEIGDDLFSVGGNGPCNKLFRRRVVESNGLRFQPLRRTNDLFFVKSCLLCSTGIAFVNRPLYHYRRGIRSATTNSELATSFCTACRGVYDLLVRTERLEKYRNAFQRMLIGSFIFNLQSLVTQESRTSWFEQVRQPVLEMLSGGRFEENPALQSEVQRNVSKALREGAPVETFVELVAPPVKRKPNKVLPPTDEDLDVLRRRVETAGKNVEQLRRKVSEARRNLAEKRRQAELASREVASLKGSAAYGVGMLVTWPLRKIYRGLLKRRAR